VTFSESDRSDHECADRIGPPGTEDRVRSKADQERAGQVSAKHVLATLTLGRGRPELVSNLLMAMLFSVVGHDVVK
jgi:hypothetical protein